MPYLQLGTTPIRLEGFRELPPVRGGAGLRRTINGQLRGVADWTKREFEGRAVARNQTEYTALRAAANPDVQIQMTGDYLDTLTVRVEIAGPIEHDRTGGGVVYRVPVMMREV